MAPTKLQIPKPYEILAPFWEKKRKSRAKYSLRALARDLEMSPGFASQILSGKKIPSPEVAKKLKSTLNLSSLDHSLLLKSIAAHSSSGGKSHGVLLELLSQDRSAKSFVKHTQKAPAELLKMTSWIHFALLDLTTLENFQNDDRWMAKRLGISLSDLHSAIDDLVNLGFLKRESGVWKKSAPHIQFISDLSHLGTRHYHKQMITKAQSVMENQTAPEDVARRRITGATLALNPEHLETAIKRINDVLYELTDLLGQGDCSEVYQFNIQLVPLTKAEKA